MLTKLFKVKSEYSKNILTLISGTGLAQLIPIAASPILTRLYSPEDFGMMALYLSILSILVAIGTGRYEMAIMLPKENEDVSAILKLILFLTLSTSFVSFIIAIFFANDIAIFFGNENLTTWLYFIPLSIILSVTYQSLNYLLIRASHFKLLANNKIMSSTSNTSLQLGVGYTLNTPWGLLFGHLASVSLTTYIIFRRGGINHFFSFRNKDAFDVAIKYQNFPKYDLPATLINLLANQLPLIILGRYFGLSVLGAYAFMYKILMMPVGLVSNSVLDVFKQKATKDYNSLGNCRDVYLLTLKQLLYISGPIFILFFIFSPDLFSFIFGTEWEKAGLFAQVMAPMFFLKFITSPLSYTLFIAGKQKQNLKGQIGIFLVSLIAVTVGLYFNDAYLFLMTLSMLNSLVYISYLVLSYKYSLGGDK